MNVLSFARTYSKRGFFCVPLPPRAKRPTVERWQELRLEGDQLEQYFNGVPCNIGVLLGIPWNLCDVDLDCREASLAWGEFAPETRFVFGRRSNPASHHFYHSDPAVRTIRYLDPEAGDENKASLLELRSFKSDGTVGLQTVMPPSIHESGELIEFVRGMDGEPANIDADELKRATAYTAACALLGRHAPKTGVRHEFFLALAGALAHAHWALSDAKRVVRAVYQVIWAHQADLIAADKETDSTFQRFDDGHEVTGLPHLQAVLKPEIFKKAIQWLGLGLKPVPAAADAKKSPKPPPKVELMSVLRTRSIAMPEQLVEGLLVHPGVTLLVGPPKAGKTVLGVQMLMSLAAGVGLFDWYKVRQVPTLIVEQDDQQGEVSLKDFEAKMRAAVNQPPCHFVTGTDFVLGPTFTAWLTQQIALFGIKVIMIDSYSSVRSTHTSGGDVVKTEMDDFGILGELARSTNTSIVVIHHDSKTSASLDWSSRAAGSYAVGAATDTQIVVNRFNESEMDEFRLVRARGRKLQDIEMVVRFRRETLDYDWVMAGPASSLYPDIRQLLFQFPENPFTAKDIMSELGWSKTTAYRVLGRLRGASILSRRSGAGGGIWSWDPNSGFGKRRSASASVSVYNGPQNPEPEEE